MTESQYYKEEIMNSLNKYIINILGQLSLKYYMRILFPEVLKKADMSDVMISCVSNFIKYTIKLNDFMLL